MVKTVIVPVILNACEFLVDEILGDDCGFLPRALRVDFGMYGADRRNI